MDAESLLENAALNNQSVDPYFWIIVFVVGSIIFGAYLVGWIQELREWWKSFDK